jgi:hypothetical protein
MTMLKTGAEFPFVSCCLVGNMPQESERGGRFHLSSGGADADDLMQPA